MPKKLTAFSITLIYLVVATLWIALTDFALGYFISDPGVLTIFQIYKGIAYIVVTSLGLYWLIKKHDNQMKTKEEKIKENRERERKYAEQRLQESEKKYRLLFEQNPQPMWIYNPETLAFVEVNRAAISHYGYSEKEFKNMTIKDIRPESDIPDLKKTVSEVMGEHRYGHEWTHQKKDGTIISVSISSGPIEFEGNQFRLVVAKDITEQKKAEKKLLNSLIEGEERERKRIAKELHDGLGQYLSASNMNFEAIREDIADLPEKKVKQFQNGIILLRAAIEETRNIAHNLMPSAIEDYGLELAVHALVDHLRKSSAIAFNYSSNLEGLALKPQIQINLYRVIQEALSNAVKHSQCQKISLQLYRHDDIITCMIEDDGVGCQMNSSAENQGMGIKSMKTRIDTLSGDIEFNSTPGKGMSILIELPVPPNIKTQE